MLSLSTFPTNLPLKKVADCKSAKFVIVPTLSYDTPQEIFDTPFIVFKASATEVLTVLSFTLKLKEYLLPNPSGTAITLVLALTFFKALLKSIFLKENKLLFTYE